jgi:RimJ/RimL family protein N-acetyltransferase
MSERDSEWLNQLFNDKTVIEKLDGITLFNQSIDRTKSFIRSFEVGAYNGNGLLWAITSDGMPIGFVSVYDIDDSPFFSYAIFSRYRGHGYFSGVIKIIEDFLLKDTYSY